MLQPVPTDPQGDLRRLDARAQRQRRSRAAGARSGVARGRKLSEARRQRGWTLDEVADRIRVRREFLEALEDMNVKLLPGKAYALAFLRSYARELGIDEKAIVDQFQTKRADPRRREQANPKPVLQTAPRAPWMAAAALVVRWGRVCRVACARTRGARRASRSLKACPRPQREPSVARRRASPSTSPCAWSKFGPWRIPGWRPVARTAPFSVPDLRAGDVYRPDPSPGWTLHARDGGAFELL
jgi:transcriptional regulator with XRE-family HTH domain